MTKYEEILADKIAAKRESEQKRQAEQATIDAANNKKSDSAHSDLTVYVLNELQKMREALRKNDVPCLLGDVTQRIADASISLTIGQIMTEDGDIRIDTVRVEVTSSNHLFIIDTFGPTAENDKGHVTATRDNIGEVLLRTFDLAVDRYLGRVGDAKS